MSRRTRLAAAAALPLLLLACSEGVVTPPSVVQTAAGGEPGACPRGTTLYVGPVSSQLRLPLSWYGVPRVREVRPAAGARPSGAHPEDDRRVLAVESPAPVRLHERVVTPSNDFDVSAQAAGEVVSEVARGSEVLVGVSRLGGAKTIVAVRKDGTVRFLGVCRDTESTQRFERAYQRMRADGYRGSRRDFLFAAIDSPDGAEAVSLSTLEEPGPEWEDVPEHLRVIAPDADPEPPAELLASLTEVQVSLRLPDSWAGFPGGLCTRTRNGWTQCGLFSVGPSGDVVLPAYVENGERPQVWLVADVAHLDTAVGKAAEGTMGSQSLLTGDASVTTYEELKRRVEAGVPVLR